MEKTFARSFALLSFISFVFMGNSVLFQASHVMEDGGAVPRKEIRKVIIKIKLEVPTNNNFRSGLNPDTFSCTLNGKNIPLNLFQKIEGDIKEVGGVNTVGILELSYTPHSEELNLNGENVIKVKIDDRFKNKMTEPAEHTFTLP